jgi:hypothetical protein
MLEQQNKERASSIEKVINNLATAQRNEARFLFVFFVKKYKCDN